MIGDIATVVLLVAGCGFFTAGTVGLLRFPDLDSRLHALTKADNLGLGLVLAGMLFQASSVAVAAKLVVIWLLALVSAAINAYLLARGGRSEQASP